MLFFDAAITPIIRSDSPATNWFLYDREIESISIGAIKSIISYFDFFSTSSFSITYHSSIQFHDGK